MDHAPGDAPRRRRRRRAPGRRALRPAARLARSTSAPTPSHIHRPARLRSLRRSGLRLRLATLLRRDLILILQR